MTEMGYVRRVMSRMDQEPDLGDEPLPAPTEEEECADAWEYWHERAHKAEAEIERLTAAVEGLLMEWDKLTKYGSPMAKAANERVNAARAALKDTTP